MPKAKKPSSDIAADPNRLIRTAAGRYRTADDRFEVNEAGIGWFLVDSARTDELGQPLMQGPFATLKAVRDALPNARRTTLKPVGPGPLPKSKSRAARPARPAPPPPPPPPPSWIDRLSRTDAATVRRLIAALEREGVDDAEPLVRRDHGGLYPEVATRRIEARLEAAVGDLPPSQRKSASRLVRRAAEVLSSEGTKPSGALPRWILVELKPDDDPPPNRRIVLRGD